MIFQGAESESKENKPASDEAVESPPKKAKLSDETKNVQASKSKSKPASEKKKEKQVRLRLECYV